MTKKASIIVSLCIVFAALCLSLFILTRSSVYSQETLTAFAQCLTQKKVSMYGAYWCPHCKNQKAVFGSAFQYVTYVECTQNEALCSRKGVEGYPTWIDEKGNVYPGEQTLERLGKMSGCAI